MLSLFLYNLDGRGTTVYTYDSMNRLLTVTEPGGKVTTYTYDTAGNRKTESVKVGTTTTVTTYNYNTQNRLTSKVVGSVTTTYTYDANGNQITETTSGVVTTNTYDVWNNLTKTVKGSVSVTNTYNGDGLRVKKVSGSVTSQYVYEYDKVILELDGAGNQKASNVYGKKLLSRVESGAASYYLYNGHGDVTTIMNASGTVMAGYYYDAFGVQLDVSGNVSNPYRYSGYVYDEETNLYYLNSRFYSAETARFLQEDSYRGEIGDPLSLNLYAYVCYNPLIYRDPTGHWMEGDDKLPQEARDQIARYTEIYERNSAIYYSSSSTEAQKKTAKLSMDVAHAGASLVRSKYTNPEVAAKLAEIDSKVDSVIWVNGSNSSGSNQGTNTTTKDTDNVSGNDDPIYNSNTINVAASGNVKSEEITALDSLNSFNVGLIRALDDNLTGGTLAFILKEAGELLTGKRISYTEGEDLEAYYLGRVIGDIVGILAGAYGAAATVEFLIGILAGGMGAAATLLSGGAGSIAGEGISIMGGELVLGGTVVAGSTGGLTGFYKDLTKYLEYSGDDGGSFLPDDYYSGNSNKPDLIKDDDGNVKLYRTMSEAEYQSIITQNKFSSALNTMEDKWFSTNIKDANTWGQRMDFGGNYRIIEITVPEASLSSMQGALNLDGIGPAFCAENGLLNTFINTIRLIK